MRQTSIATDDESEAGSIAVLLVAVLAILVVILAGFVLLVGPPAFLRDAAGDSGLIQWTPTPISSTESGPVGAGPAHV